MIIRGTDIKMIRGDSETLQIACDNFTLQKEDIIYLTVKKSPQLKEKAFQKIVEGIEGDLIIFDILPTDTKHLPFGKYWYDIQVNFVNGDVKTIVPLSSFEILAEVTHE